MKECILKNLNYTGLCARREEINIPILIFSFFTKFIHPKLAYKITFIKYVKPKLIITNIDTSFELVSALKKIFPHIIFFMIQNGIRLKRDFYFSGQKKFDKYFIHCKEDIYFFKKNKINTNYSVIGSYVNNMFKRVKFQKIKKIQYL